MRKKYQADDKCTHCGGNISPNLVGTKVIYWCDDCGSNNPSNPPSVTVKLVAEAVDKEVRFVN